MSEWAAREHPSIGAIAYLADSPEEWVAVDTSDPDWPTHAAERLEVVHEHQRRRQLKRMKA